MTVAEIKELILSRGVFSESTLHKLKKFTKLRKRGGHAFANVTKHLLSNFFYQKCRITKSIFFLLLIVLYTSSCNVFFHISLNRSTVRFFLGNPRCASCLSFLIRHLCKGSDPDRIWLANMFNCSPTIHSSASSKGGREGCKIIL